MFLVAFHSAICCDFCILSFIIKIIIIIIIIIFFLPSVGVPEGGKKLVIKEKKNINTPMASDPGGSRQ